MARKTIKSLEEQIERLRELLDGTGEANRRLINELAAMKDLADDNFKKSPLYNEMKKEIDYLNLRIKTKEGILETVNKRVDSQDKWIQDLLKENEQLKANAPVHKDVKNSIDDLKEAESRDSNNNIEELQKKLNITSERNKAIIKDYAKCSKENEHLKAKLKELEAKQIGRPKKLNNEIVQKVIELRKDNKSIRAIAKELKISVGSVHNIIEQNNI